MGPEGKAIGGADAPFTQVPNGIPGLETRLPLLMTHGVLAGRIDVHTFVALTSTNPAKLYGLAIRAWPRLTLCRGREVCRERRYLGEPGYGRFLPCDRPEPAAVRGRGYQGPIRGVAAW